MVDLEASTVFMIGGLAIAVGFVANLLFNRLKAPDALILMLFGFLVGPGALGLIGSDLKNIVDDLGPFVSALALAFIMFNGGLELDLKQVVGAARSTTLLAVGGFGLIVTTVFCVLILGLGFRWEYALLGGVVFGSTSAPTVIPMIMRMACSDRIKTILTLESAISDVIVVGLGTAIVIFLVSVGSNLMDTALGLLTSTATAFGVGLLSSLVWAKLMPKLQYFKYFYILTLGVIILLFALCEIIAPYGGGVIVVLVFGLVLNNAHYVHGMLSRSFRKPMLNAEFQVLNEETAFFVKVFFFTFLGLYVSTIDFQAIYIVFGVVIFLVLLLDRWVMTNVVRDDADLDEVETLMIRTMFPKGLCTVVTALLPLSYGLDLGAAQEQLMGLVALVVVLTTLLSSIGAIWAERMLCVRRPGQAERTNWIEPEF